MTLSLKSLQFAKKILKYNPLPKTYKQQHQDHEDHENCNHEKPEQQQLKPYLHVHDHRKEREIYEKPTSSKLQNMKVFKQEGNEHFKNKRFQQALHYYQKIIIYADYTFPDSEKDKKLMEELVQSANCNMGIGLNKLGQIKKAIDNFSQAVKGPVEKITIKAAYWLVKNHVSLGQFQKAEKQLIRLKSYGKETEKQVQQLQMELKTNKEAYQKSSKNLYGQMFTS